MSEDKRDYEKEWTHIVDAIAESVGDSQHGISEELRESGRDPKLAANEVRATLLEAVGDFYRKRRLALQEAQETKVAPEQALRTAKIPTSIEEARALLLRVLDIFPRALTFQGRELTELTDADVMSTLEKMHRLGVLDELQRHDEGEK